MPVPDVTAEQLAAGRRFVLAMQMAADTEAQEAGLDAVTAILLLAGMVSMAVERMPEPLRQRARQLIIEGIAAAGTFN